MSDGKRKIDYVLAFDSSTISIDDANGDDNENHAEIRKQFEHNLSELGLVLEYGTIEVILRILSDLILWAICAT
jgi:hypothetical protein